MEIKTEKKEGCVLEIDLHIPHGEIVSSEEEVLKYFQSQAAVPGFRKGKAPKQMVMARFKDDLKKTVLKEVLWSKISEYMEKQAVRIIGDPYVRDVSYDLGGDLSFKAVLELYPVFDMIDYKNIPAEVEKVAVTEEDEKNAIEDLREKYSQFQSSPDGTAQRDSFAIIDYELFVDGASIEKKSSTWVKLTEEAYIKEFTTQIAGMKIGDEKDIDATLPENYIKKEMAGKKGLFKVKLIDVKNRIKPELNDEFAKMVGPFENLAAMNEQVKKNLEELKERQKRVSIENQISEYIIKNVKMELPPTLLLQEEQSIVRETLQRLHYSGMSEEEIKKRVSDISKEAKEKARENLVIHIFLEKVVEIEKIESSDEDVEKEYERLARVLRIPMEKVREKYSSEHEKEHLISQIKKIKAVDFLINAANIKTKD